ncbi:putative ankyrin repeat protein RF_0381 [Patella vulgata]|uniref:putative ankyrin repeat protein RF_0381 n=1 Tax=Patella vulgata TaxID=6465 RepID=UPI0024A98FEC|nr:putative ankyrin repeat protein RF_0381 [Patella vulgata]
MDGVEMVDDEEVGDSRAIEDKYNRLEKILYSRQGAEISKKISEFCLDEVKQLCKLALKRKSLKKLKLVFSRRCVLSCDYELDLAANRELISSAIESDFVEGLVYLYDRGLVLDSDGCKKYSHRLKSERWSALAEAVQNIKYKATEYILSIPTVISTETSREILATAITRKDIRIVKLLVRNSEVQSHITTESIPLIPLCFCDNEEYGTVVDEETRLELIKVLVDAGSSLDLCNKHGQTPLMLAVVNGMFTIFNYLLDNRADANCVDRKRQNVLHYLILSDPDTSSNIERLINIESNFNYEQFYESNYKYFQISYIHFAVEYGKFKLATHLMKSRHVDVSLKDDRYNNLLHLVAQHNSDQSVEFAQSLIEKGIDVDHRDNAGKTPLHTACAYNNINITRMLLEARSDVNVKDCYGTSVLMIAVGHQNMELVELLLTYGADVNGTNVLLKAAQYRNMKLVKLLTKYGADVNFIDSRGENVCLNCFYKQNEVSRISSFVFIKLFIDLGFDIDRVNYENGILYAAARTNELLSFQLLLNSITKLDRVDDMGENIFHILSKVKGFSYSKVVSLFEKENLKKQKNKTGNTPLMLASFLLNTGYLDVSTTNGRSDVVIQNKYGHTALHMCMLGFIMSTAKLGSGGENRLKFRKCVKSLLNAGTNVNIQDNNGVTPLMMAAMIEDKIIIKYCMKFGADITILDYKYEMSALQYLSFKSSCVCLPELLSKDRNALVNLPGKDGNTLIQRALLFPLFWDPKESVDIICYLLAVNCNLQHLQSVSTERNYFTEDIDLDDFNFNERDRLRKLLYLSGAPEEEIVLSLNFEKEDEVDDDITDNRLHSRHREQFKLFCNNISLQSRCRRVIRQIVGSRLHIFIVASNIPHLLYKFLFLEDGSGGEVDITLNHKYFVTREDQIEDRGGEYDEEEGNDDDSPNVVDFDDRGGEYDDEDDGSDDYTTVNCDDASLSSIKSMYGHVKYINVQNN